MTRGEVGKHLNSILEALEVIGPEVKRISRAKERIDSIRDMTILLALDLGLPVQPVKEKTDESHRDPTPPTG